LLLLALVAGLGFSTGAFTGPQATTGASAPVDAPMMSSAAGAPALQSSATENAAPFVTGSAAQFDVSPPLRDIPAVPVEKWTTVRAMPEPKGEDSMRQPAAPPVDDPVVQKTFGSELLDLPSPSVNFEGINNRNGVYPPDTNGDIGPNHFVQTVNLSFAVYSRSGAVLLTPRNTNTLWSGFGGPCETQNAGDPIVLYDQMADRWLISQFTSSAPYGECVAISTTGNPTGSYYRYFFQFSTSVFYDYPHFGIWPDGYYMSANRFGGIFQSFQGPSAIVLDRTKMLAGDSSAGFQQFNLSTSYGTLLPADMDGSTLPAAGASEVFMARATNALQMWRYHVDWANSGNSTFTGPTTLATAAYNVLCGGTRNCIPQPGTNVGLDGIGDRLMYRLAYRNLGDHESLVVNHSVNASGGVAGVRWYEVRNPFGSPTIYQQGTYAPDSTNRWMGSVAMDGQGNMAMVYSASSSSVYPSIRYTGRLAGDPLGQMPQGEQTLIAGSGSQTGTAYRWGDYASITVDPTDDCTFWFTTEYIRTTGGAPWQTRVGAFNFPGCGGTPPTPVPTTVATNTPVPTNTPVNTPTPTNTPTNTPTPNPNQPDFSVSVTPASRTIARGQNTTYAVTLTSLNGFAGNVSLSVSGLPNKTSANFSPNPVAVPANGSASSTLTISTQRNGATGTYTLTITGSNGSNSHSQQVTLVLTR
jgi:hypothetical protein